MRGVRILAAGLVMAAGAAAALDPPPPPSGPPWYSVEVLVFRYTGPDAAQGELWPATVAAPPLSGALYPAAAATAGTYLALPAPSTTIARAQARLAAAGGYQTVVTAGWTQPGVGATAARPVRVTPPPVDATSASSAATPATRRTAFSQTAPQAVPVALTAAGPAPVRVDGTATLIVADNKPHIALDLRLCEPPPPGLQFETPTAATAPPAATSAIAGGASLPAAPLTVAPAAASNPHAQCFSLRQRRQVSPGQLAYFDNPAFGALVLVTPVTPPAAATGVPRAGTAPGPSRSPATP